jgi:hypothetical protein
MSMSFGQVECCGPQVVVDRTGEDAGRDAPSSPKYVAPSALPGLSGEIARRAVLLAEYQSATGVSEYFIYTHAKSGIHKPQFRAWKKATLAVDSATAQNFERFLLEKAVPPPQREKRKQGRAKSPVGEK